MEMCFLVGGCCGRDGIRSPSQSKCPIYLIFSRGWRTLVVSDNWRYVFLISVIPDFLIGSNHVHCIFINDLWLLRNSFSQDLIVYVNTNLIVVSKTLEELGKFFDLVTLQIIVPMSTCLSFSNIICVKLHRKKKNNLFYRK